MRGILTSIFILSLATCFGQELNVIGTYSNGITVPKLIITFNPDSTFTYSSTEHPTFYRWEGFSEKGKWTVSADTIILNPQLASKPYVEFNFQEQKKESDTAIFLTFNHIKRYFDKDGSLVEVDTVQVDRLDYAFNELKKKKLVRVAPHRTTRCAFAGYIPPEIITTNRTIAVSKPHGKLKSIFIGCYELQGTKEFQIKDPGSNYLALNIYSNYYLDEQIRQKKLLIKNKNVLYSRQNPDDKFDKGNWNSEARLKKIKNPI